MAVAKDVTNSQIREKPTYENTSMHVANIVKDKQKELGSSTLTPAFVTMIINQNNFEKIIRPSVNSDIDAIVNNTDSIESVVNYSSISNDDKVLVNYYLSQTKNHLEHIKDSINTEYVPTFSSLVKNK